MHLLFMIGIELIFYRIDPPTKSESLLMDWNLETEIVNCFACTSALTFCVSDDEEIASLKQTCGDLEHIVHEKTEVGIEM